MWAKTVKARRREAPSKRHLQVTSMHMEVRALFVRFVWRGVNIDDVTIHSSRGSRIKSRINPTLKVCEHNQVARTSQDTFLQAGLYWLEEEVLLVLASLQALLHPKVMLEAYFQSFLGVGQTISSDDFCCCSVIGLKIFPKSS